MFKGIAKNEILYCHFDLRVDLFADVSDVLKIVI